MKNKQKLWRRPEVQKAFRDGAIKAALTMAKKVTGKAVRFFLDRAEQLKDMRIGRMLKEHMVNMPKVA